MWSDIDDFAAEAFRDKVLNLSKLENIFEEPD